MATGNLVGKKWLFVAAAFGVAQALVAAVQKVEITSANAYAYSAENPLVCDSGSQITVKHSYRSDGRTMKEALIDFIQVTPAAAGEPDPWVSVRLIEGGLANDVDFSEQPYLWLGSVTHGNAYGAGFYDVLEGVYEPYGDVYRFGYDGTYLTGEVGILVTNLVDNPVTGAPRSIVVRGKGSTCLRTITGSVCTFSGSVTVEDGAYLTALNSTGISGTPRLIIRNGGRLVIKSTASSLPATTALEIDGTAEFFISGGGTGPRFTINGPVCGNGTIKILDQGGLAFYGTNNTFTGSVVMANMSAGTVPLAVMIGDGTHFSWGGADVTGLSLPRHQLILNTSADATFTGKLPSGGLVVKRGVGRVTLTQPIDRTAAAESNLPAFTIEGGALVRGAAEETPLTGVMSLGGGTAFDLGGIPCASCCLPCGGGSVVNPAPDSTTRFAGAWTNVMEFAGTLEGNVRLENDGGHPWTVTGDASIAGDMTLGKGLFEFESFFVSTNTVTVEENARLLFSGEEYRRRLSMTGLALDIWTVPFRGDHETYYTNCLSLIGSAAPEVRTDMSLFPNGIHSGETSGNAETDPFTRVLGESKNYFCALFSGYFYAETDGEYSFSIHADDNGAVWVDGGLVVRCASGNANAESRGSVNLTRGWHTFKTMFGEESGWEVFIVKVKRPGDSDYIDFPPETLAAAVGPGTRIASLAGTGSIGLAEGGIWPVIDDVSGFAGSVVANGSTAGDAGVLPLNSARVAQDDDKDMFNGFWTPARQSAFIATNNVRAIDFTPGEPTTKGAVNTTEPIRLDRAWDVSFNYRAIRPRGSNMGDGFFIGVHGAGATAWDGGIFGYYENNQRLAQPTAYGLQVYIYNTGLTQLVWVNNNVIYKAPGPIVTNQSLIVWRNLDENPMRVTMSYDGTEKLVVSFRQGEEVLAVTNAFAGADFAAKFTDGTARIGIWGSNGSFYTRTLIDHLTFSTGDEVVSEPVLGGELELRGGTVTALPGLAEPTTLAASLKVVGPATLDATAAALACTATEWSFDLDRADAALTVRGDVTFPAAVSLDLATTAPWPDSPRLLADFSAYSGSLPVFSLAETVPRSVRLSQAGGKLYVCKASGTTIIFR